MEGRWDDNKWSFQSTKLLLTLYLENKDNFRDPRKRNKNVWNSIIERMEKCGVKDLSIMKLDRKFRNLKKTYIKIKMSNKCTKWQYYEDMDKIFCDDLAVSSCQTLSSFETDDENYKQFSSWQQFRTDSDDGHSCSSSLDTASTPPEVSTHPSASRKRKAGAQRDRYSHTKKIIELEERRTEELRAIRDLLQDSNQIQAERNQLLKEYISNMLVIQK